MSYPFNTRCLLTREKALSRGLFYVDKKYLFTNYVDNFVSTIVLWSARLVSKLIIFLLVYLCVSVYAFEARVIAVSDGDTVTVLDGNNHQIKIRLAQIDAPEKRQSFGQKSKDALAHTVLERIVEIKPLSTDKYKRTVATVLIEGVDVGLLQVRNGWAWAYDKYVTDKLYLDAQERAKDSRFGLWKDNDPLPPWEFRKRKIDGGVN